MSWSDTFFPDNPRRREEVVRLGQQLLSLMEHNFWATNRLATLLNREMNTGLREISVDKQKTIKENCDMLIDTIGSIQAQVAQIDSRLKENLEPELYQKLYSLTVPLSDRIHIASRVLSGAFGVLGSGVTVAELIHKGAVLSRIVASLGRVGTCAVATVVLGVLGLGVDMVASAILGAIERENLERVIQEYSEALEEFRPASEQYLENIGNVIARVQFKRGH